MKPKLSFANAVILVSGAVLVLGSFLPFYKIVGHGVSAWSAGLFGIATVVVFCGGAMALQIALATFGSGTLQPKPFGLTWDQVHLALGFQATVMMLSFLAQRRSEFVTYGTGFWLMLAAAIALFVGALLRLGSGRRRSGRGGLRSV
jgi:hypothetical protein